mgnify:CR=1 FL=1
MKVHSEVVNSVGLMKPGSAVELTYYRDGKKQYEVHYDYGKKVGTETSWDPAGNRKWARDRRADGTATWTHYWPNGQKKIESRWTGLTADGAATRWDRDGRVVAENRFDRGTLVEQ